jgi:hypothetical protein
VAAAIEANCHQSIESLAVVPGTSVSSIDAISVNHNLGLENSLARWVSKLFRDQRKQQCDDVCSELAAAVHRCCLTKLDCIVNMNDTMVSYLSCLSQI